MKIRPTLSFNFSRLCSDSHTPSCPCESSPIFYFCSSRRAVFWQEALKWMRELRPRCADAVVKGTLSSHRLGGERGERDSTHLLPSHLSPRRGGWVWQPVLPSCSRGPGLQKPQADNECHTIVTTCTFMERRRKDIFWHRRSQCTTKHPP